MNTPHDKNKRHPRPAPKSVAVRPALGFTLIEAMVVLTVLGVLAAVAIPAMGRMADSARLTALSNDFLSAMHVARSEAIKRNRSVALCKSANGVECVASGGWEQGWIVFHDPNNNGTADPGEPVVHRAPSLPSGFIFSGNQNVSRYISFNPMGRTRLLNGGFQAGTLTLCKFMATDIGARQIVINVLGRARVDKAPGDVCP